MENGVVDPDVATSASSHQSVPPDGFQCGLLAADVPLPKAISEVAGTSGTPFSRRTSDGTRYRSDEGYVGAQRSVGAPHLLWDQVEVVHAEDDMSFHLTLKARLAVQGIPVDAIHSAEDGLEAMELLLKLQDGDETRPLMFILDTRMPHMDGNECAMRVRALSDRGMLRRPPFVVGCTAYRASNPHATEDNDQDAVFHVRLSKEASMEDALSVEDGPLRRCFNKFQNWWKARSRDDWKRWGRFELARTNCVIADDWPVCRETFRQHLLKLGLTASLILEADDGQEALSIVRNLLQRGSSEPTLGPLFVMLDQTMPYLCGGQCAAQIRLLVEERAKYNSGRAYLDPFLVCVSATDGTERFSAEDRKVFHCFLPKTFTHDDLRWVLELFRLWWLEKNIAAEKKIESSGSLPDMASRDTLPDMTNNGSDSDTSVGAGDTSSCAELAEDLVKAMQIWRLRREKKLEKRQSQPRSYGDMLRSGGKTSGDVLAQLLEELWPGQYLFHNGEQIGSGAQADVFLGKRKVQGSFKNAMSPVAIKVFRGVEWTVGHLEALRRELEISTSVRHEHLVESFMCTVEIPPMLIQEFCEGGNLQTLLQVSPPGCILNLAQRLKIALDIARGAAYLHQLVPAVVHRDLKPENVLLKSQITSPLQVPLAKVGDFGLARCIKSEDRRKSFMTRGAGSLCYTAPEVFHSGDYDVQVDVHSFGVVLFALLTSTIPYGDMSLSSMKLEQFVSEGGRPDSVASPEALKMLAKVPAGVVVLMHQAWHREPSERGSLDAQAHELTRHWMCAGGLKQLHVQTAAPV